VVFFSRAARWCGKNLFSSLWNTLATGLCFYLLYKTLVPAVGWLLIEADFVGVTPKACTSGGACWVFVRTHFNQFMYGFYPLGEYWRIQIAIVLGMGWVLLLLSPWLSRRFKQWMFGLFVLVYPVVAGLLFVGGWLGLPYVSTTRWGGLHLTLVVAFTGIALSLPLGVFLALGRRSKLPIIRACCVGFIELWRGVPLISVLFMASVMLPLFLPEGVYVDKLLRALLGVALFSSAYMAEVIRGGLQALPKGQYEAASSLGLGYWQTMAFVILPQALKIVIPGIVNTFIGLFKDTTLVLTIGLFDLLGMVQSASTDPTWLAYHVEGYVFTASVFWLFCFAMSRYSQRLKNTSGGFSSTMRPSSIKTIRSAMVLAKPISWVTHNMVIPSSAKPIITSKTSFTISGSSAEVGSSNNMIRGLMHKLLAIATRCCWPPDNCSGYLFACSVILTRSKYCIAILTASARRIFRTQMGAKVQFSSAVKCGNKLNC